MEGILLCSQSHVYTRSAGRSQLVKVEKEKNRKKAK